MSLPDPRAKSPRTLVRVTLVVIAASLLILLTWDVVVANNAWRGDTVSELTMWAVLRSLTLSTALGFVAGHLTWPGSKRRPVWTVLLSGGTLLLACGTLDALTWFGSVDWTAVRFLHRYPQLPFGVSYVLGRVFWPQVRS